MDLCSRFNIHKEIQSINDMLVERFEYFKATYSNSNDSNDQDNYENAIEAK